MTFYVLITAWGMISVDSMFAYKIKYVRDAVWFPLIITHCYKPDVPVLTTHCKLENTSLKSPRTKHYQAFSQDFV